MSIIITKIINGGFSDLKNYRTKSALQQKIFFHIIYSSYSIVVVVTIVVTV